MSSILINISKFINIVKFLIWVRIILQLYPKISINTPIELLLTKINYSARNVETLRNKSITKLIRTSKSSHGIGEHVSNSSCCDMMICWDAELRIMPRNSKTLESILRLLISRGRKKASPAHILPQNQIIWIMELFISQIRDKT